MLFLRAEICRLQAEQARRSAESAPHPFERELFLELAADWEKVAREFAREARAGSDAVSRIPI